jgi:hypothetical protein
MVPGPQSSYQKWHHICSTVKFVEQNFYFSILRTQNFNILSTPLSFKYKIVKQMFNQICSTVKNIEQKNEKKND